ncbi:MAG: ubiquinol-cytochrome c reductase iron-sulfur subunit [Gammaproteobacteria bacterium]
MSENAVDPDRRRFLTGTASVIGGIGAGIAAIPFVATFQPSARAKAIGAPVEADIGQLEPGQRVTYKWRGKPVWIVRRTSEQLSSLESMNNDILRDPQSQESLQPGFADNAWRSAKPEYLVLVGICTHLGCSPNFFPQPGAEGMGADWNGGFYCPCHGSKFDLAGRVYAGVPAPLNLEVPPYRYIDDTHIMIGEMEDGAA